ncbi:MAG: hypothetical protein JRH20_23470, partial [Deltaproteobacteria bacterium]|nr:hypothetical protein [Deltaproteobacteria bacterium]
MFFLAACPHGAQVVAQRADDQGLSDGATDDGGPIASCPWQVEEMAHELPIGISYIGIPIDYRAVFDQEERQFALITKDEVDPLSTKVFFQRFSDRGLALGPAIILQPELPPLQTGAVWDHSLLGVVHIREAWVALWSQMAYLKDATG